MATLQELMAECFGESETDLLKQASAPKTSTDEIDQVLANLGLEDSEAVSAATESETSNNGGSMGLMDIYEEIMSETPAATEEAQQKVASEYAAEENAATTQFGELVGQYFNFMAGPFFSKVAGDLEAEAGAGHHPMGDLDASSQLGKSLGKQSDPHLPVNHKPENGKALPAAKGDHPYSLKEIALIKQILSRLAAGHVGAYKE